LTGVVAVAGEVSARCFFKSSPVLPGPTLSADNSKVNALAGVAIESCEDEAEELKLLAFCPKPEVNSPKIDASCSSVTFLISAVFLWYYLDSNLVLAARLVLPHKERRHPDTSGTMPRAKLIRDVRRIRDQPILLLS
jgi:hypothetical protein